MLAQGLATGALDAYLIAFAGLLLALLPWAIVEAVRGLDRRTLFVLGVAAGVALIARVIAPHRLVMVYFGYEHVGQAVDLHALPRYGPGATLLWWLLFRVAPADHAAVQWLHAVVGSITVGLWAAYVHRTTGSLLGAAGTALVLALSPVFIRDHVSESMAVPAMLAFAAVALLAVEVVRRSASDESSPRRPAVALVVGALFGASCRPDLALAAAPFVLAFALAAHPARSVWTAARRLWPYAAAAVVLATPLLAFAYLRARADLAAGSLPRLEHGDFLLSVAARLFTDNLLLDPSRFPVVVWAPLIAGAVVSRAARRAAWLVAAAVVALAPTFVDFNEVSILRLHVPAASLLVVAGGFGFAALGEGGRAARVVAACLVAATVASALPSGEALFRIRNPDQEEALIREVVRRLDPVPRPVHLHRFGEGDVSLRGLHLHFPDYLFTERGIRTANLRDLDGVPLASSQRRFFFSSLRCHLWPMTEPGSRSRGLHRICAEVCERFRCEPVFERDLPNLGDWSYFDGYGEATRLRVGLYRLLPRADGRPGSAAHEPGPRERAIEEAAWELSRREPSPEALALYLTLARRNPRHPVVHSRIVATLAPTLRRPEHAGPYLAAADARPGDPLAQFVAGVAAHYAAHNAAHTVSEKRTLYRQALHYLRRARPALDFEPRLFIYLAVSHFRLGHQARAESHIDTAVRLGKEDPDVFYCRAEIYQRKDPKRALRDIEVYLAMTERMLAEGTLIHPGKQARVKRMYEHLRAVSRGEAKPEEIFDPLRAEERFR